MPDDKPRFTLVSKKETLDNFLNNYKFQVLKLPMGGMRAWIKVFDDPADLLARTTKKGQRKMTCDVTDRDGPWMYIRDPKNVKMSDLRGNNKYLELIAEYCEASYYSTFDGSPRSALLNKWKLDLKPGDTVDCCDNTNHWNEAVITSISADGSLSVHFKGWGTSFDEVITKSQAVYRIQPLNTRTRNWRDTLEEDDYVEINVARPGEPAHWAKGQIVEKDIAGGRVRVSYEIIAVKQYVSQVVKDRYISC
jgi:hypothetical protein